MVDEQLGRDRIRASSDFERVVRRREVAAPDGERGEPAELRGERRVEPRRARREQRDRRRMVSRDGDSPRLRVRDAIALGRVARHRELEPCGGLGGGAPERDRRLDDGCARGVVGQEEHGERERRARVSGRPVGRASVEPNRGVGASPLDETLRAGYPSVQDGVLDLMGGPLRVLSRGARAGHRGVGP